MTKFVKIGDLYINPNHVKMVSPSGDNHSYIHFIDEKEGRVGCLPIETVMELLGYVERDGN